MEHRGDAELEQAVLDLLEQARTAEGKDRTQVAEDLAALCPAAFPLLLTSLARERLPDGLGGGGLDERLLEPIQSMAIEQALLGLSGDVLRSCLRGIPRDAESRPELAIGIELIGATGGRGDVLFLTRLADPAPGERRVDAEVRSAYERALTSLLEREPLALNEVHSGFGEAHPSLLADLIHATGETRSPEAFAVLAGLLGRIPDADLLLLVEIDRIGADLPRPVDETSRLAVRRYLDDIEPRNILAAASACGTLEDSGAAERLVGLLSDRRPGVAAGAHDALARLEGRDLGAAPQVWQEWYRSQRTWWEQDAGLELRLLADGPPEAVARITKGLVDHRLYRHEIAARLVDLLGRPEADLVALGCALLGHLRSSVAVPGLVRALEHPQAQVRREAHRALVKITGRKLPQDAAAWREGLQS